MSPTPTQRINSIDVLRGIVMVIMALDHVRDFIHIDAFTKDPLAINNYSLPLYFTRWITHFCAPVFVFLSGTSIYLQSFRKTNEQLGAFVIKRGLWLILIEWTVIAFAWTFNPNFNFFPLQVIWAIGISMVILGSLLFFNIGYKTILLIGSLIVLGHNSLDFIERKAGFQPGFWWDLLHTGVWKQYTLWNGHIAMIIYPFLAWTGLMFLGYCCGKLFERDVRPESRFKQLRTIGIILLAAFVMIRYSNIYGDPVPWAPGPTAIQTILSFLNVNKYPPSLLYILVTIGFGLIALAYLEKASNSFTAVMKTFGRTAFFYYILHFYLIHLIAVAIYFIHGNTINDIWKNGKDFPFLFVIPGQGVSLTLVYIIWLAVVCAIYPLSKWYESYKMNNKDKWWLSYL